MSERNRPEGAHNLATRVGARPTPWARPLPRRPPVGPPVAIFCYMKSFVRRKIISKLSGQDSAATRRNLGGTNLGLRQSCSAGDTSLREGEIIAIVITNAPLIGRGQSPSTSSQHHLLSNPSSSLVSNLCPKTLDWYLWVASSVDYSL